MDPVAASDPLLMSRLPLAELAGQILGLTVCVNWPHLKEAKVVQVRKRCVLFQVYFIFRLRTLKMYFNPLVSSKFAVFCVLLGCGRSRQVPNSNHDRGRRPPSAVD